MTGMGKINDQFIILLNIDRIFSSEELVIVQETGQLESQAEAVEA